MSSGMESMRKKVYHAAKEGLAKYLYAHLSAEAPEDCHELLSQVRSPIPGHDRSHCWFLYISRQQFPCKIRFPVLLMQDSFPRPFFFPLLWYTVEGLYIALYLSLSAFPSLCHDVFCVSLVFCLCLYLLSVSVQV